MQQHLLTNFTKALDMFCHGFCSFWSLPCIVPGRTSEAHLFKDSRVRWLVKSGCGLGQLKSFIHIYTPILQSSFWAENLAFHPSQTSKLWPLDRAVLAACSPIIQQRSVLQVLSKLPKCCCFHAMISLLVLANNCVATYL